MLTPNPIRLLLGYLVLCGCLGAQTSTISSVRVSTAPEGARFYVDGLPYVAAQIFLWPQGSKHIVQFPTDANLNGSSSGCQVSQSLAYQYCFSSWSDSSGSLTASGTTDQTVTASPSVTWLQATLNVSYKVHVRFFDGPANAGPTCGSAPGNTPQDAIRPGLLYVAGNCVATNADIWAAAGPISLNAFPYPGFVFTGWNINGQQIDAYLKSYSITGPATIFAGFQSAKRVQFVSNPQGMKLLIDRTPTPTASTESRDSLSGNFPPCQLSLNLPPMPPLTIPALCFGQFDFLPGSKHVIGAVTPQLDNTGKYWVFDKFSNGAEANSLYTPDSNTSMPDVITANFAPAVQAAFLTSPAGLKLSIDGRSNWQTYSFLWAANSTHAVNAPATQVDANGRQWTFQGWSNGGAAAQTLAMDANNLTLRLVATYTSLGQLQVLTNPPGIKLQIDAADCTSPCSVDRAAGTQVTIAAPQSVPVDGSSRLDFLGWSDGGSASHSVAVNGDARTIYANYGPSYKLSVSADPDGGVDVRMDPPSPDLFYRADTAVTLTATARSGFRFRRWGGDLAGVYNVGQLTLAGPRSVMALLDRIPYLAPAGIKNAAGDTPDGTVAPGSIISIYGESLAPRLEIGPSNPLAQSIADVVVTVNDRILPLLFVSPQQINAQINSDLPDGDYTLTVRWTGKPDVTGKFRISRDAPGLFSRAAGPQQAYALALHPDGSLVTPDAPAQRGEMVSVYGTGFGPYDRKIIDGFALPGTLSPMLMDPVEVNAAGQSIQPDWSGGATGYVGMVVTRFQVPDSTPSANVELRVKVNGKASNIVLLPVQ